ncbi:helix-turn-helix transcriptional regulator [Streptomyces sp. NPDC020917]|uniref:helix-turn-helix transcriptional regulator n=1 Tax=Streptomyces sp. NPDC020917 TaxID=3365102 RepID=UPI00379961F2
MATSAGRAPSPRPPAAGPSTAGPAADRARREVPDPGAAELSPRRRAVLDALRAAADPQGINDVAERLAVHPNTVRFHLDALVADGHVERTLEDPSGPGRPRTVYAARRGMDRGGARSYRLLARMLLSRLAASAGPGTGSGAEAGTDDAADAGGRAAGDDGIDAGTAAAVTETGRAWGRYLVEQLPPSGPPTAEDAVGRLTAMLDDLGFDPQQVGAGAVPDRIRLRHCPFLELAEEYGRIVCPLHLGLMQGALDELRAPVAATGLEPFAEPGACLAHLSSVTSRPGRSPRRGTSSDRKTTRR